jgi:hypothetical protein
MADPAALLPYNSRLFGNDFRRSEETRAMTPEEAADAWHRFLLRTGPLVDRNVLRWAAELLASDAGPVELLAIADDLTSLATVIAEEARAEAMATPA